MTIMRPHTLKQAGLSLIELMIAMVIGLVALLGITSLFTSTSTVNRMENGLARLQENGRFATAMIQQDIKMATFAGGMRKTSGDVIGRVDPDTSIVSLVDMGSAGRSIHGLPGPYAGATADRYHIPRSFMIRGYRCLAGGCTPQLGSLLPGDDLYGGGVPAMGTSAGSRVRGADVLTLRYLRDDGVPVVRGSILPLAEGAEQIQLDAPLVVGPTRVVIVSDYQTAVLLSVAETGATTQLTPAGNRSSAANGLSVLQGLSGDRRVADFDAGFVTVTYYLGLTSDASSPGRLISSLFRRENGVAQEIAQGIERMDFLYHVENVEGRVAIHSAESLSGLNPATFGCVRSYPMDNSLLNFEQPICPWRSVRAAEIYLLANTVTDAASHQEPFLYSFLADGAVDAASTVQVACDPAYGACPGGAITVLPSGLPPGRMMRREFRTSAVIRNAAF